MQFRLILSLAFAVFAAAFLPRLQKSRSFGLAAIEITTGVQFDTIAREWRLKWSTDNEKSSLVEVQKVLNSIVADVKAVDGVKSVQRVVCGGCLDYKVIISLPAESFGAWEQKKFAPEENFILKVSAIPGVTSVETQTYTLTPI